MYSNFNQTNFRKVNYFHRTQRFKWCLSTHHFAWLGGHPRPHFHVFNDDTPLEAFLGCGRRSLFAWDVVGRPRGGRTILLAALVFLLLTRCWGVGCGTVGQTLLWRLLLLFSTWNEKQYLKFVSPFSLCNCYVLFASLLLWCVFVCLLLISVCICVTMISVCMFVTMISVCMFVTMLSVCKDTVSL